MYTDNNGNKFWNARLFPLKSLQIHCQRSLQIVSQVIAKLQHQMLHLQSKSQLFWVLWEWYSFRCNCVYLEWVCACFQQYNCRQIKNGVQERKILRSWKDFHQRTWTWLPVLNDTLIGWINQELQHDVSRSNWRWRCFTKNFGWNRGRRSETRLSQTISHFFWLSVVVKNSFFRSILPFRSVFLPSCLCAKTRRKRVFQKVCISLKEFFTLTMHFTVQKTKRYMLHCPVIKSLSPELCRFDCRLVSEWVTQANPQSFICFRIYNAFRFMATFTVQSI